MLWRCWPSTSFARKLEAGGHKRTDLVWELSGHQAPLLFLSHAGVDTEAALAFAERIEASPAARAAGLRVWVDKNLVPGRGWQRQLEEVIERQSTAFAVYLGVHKAINWVEAEIRVALNRATKDSNYSFIPILIGKANIADLPAFARQYHGLQASDDTDLELLQQIVSALVEPTQPGAVAMVEQPFVGLASFDQTTSELFYGRDAETDDLVERLRRKNFIMVVGDSGSGKSSLVRAGLAPRFRGGAYADISGDQPDRTFWQVIEMKAQKHPFERLVDAVNDAATKCGISARERGEYANWIRTREPEKIRDAIRDSAPSPSQALLIVDQFEALWTQASGEDRVTFVKAVLRLADLAAGSCRIVVTMRRDYYNLYPALCQDLKVEDVSEKFLMRRMKDTALREAILRPLKLNEYRDDQSNNSFAEVVLRDVGDRPGDLALLEMALAESWRHRGAHRGRLLEAYAARGGVTGALANAAEEVFKERLEDLSIDVIKGVFVRLVRLGDTGGTTRRIARREDFTHLTWPLVQELAGGSQSTDKAVVRQDESTSG